MSFNDKVPRHFQGFMLWNWGPSSKPHRTFAWPNKKPPFWASRWEWLVCIPIYKPTRTELPFSWDDINSVLVNLAFLPAFSPLTAWHIILGMGVGKPSNLGPLWPPHLNAELFCVPYISGQQRYFCFVLFLYLFFYHGADSKYFWLYGPCSPRQSVNDWA